jgi:dCMP deaminase
MCAKSLINAGITEVVFSADYPDTLTQEMLDEAGVKIRRFVLE